MAMTRAQAEAQAHVLAVDFAACDGHGLCVELLPELVGLDEWGYPVLRRPTVPPDLLPTRGTAAPRRAVSHGQPG